MSKTLAGRNFERLRRLLPYLADLASRERRVLVAQGHPDLRVEVLSRSDHVLYLSLGHYHALADQLLAHPEMTVCVDLLGSRAEAVSLLAGTHYQDVYAASAIDRRAQESLGRYLGNWLCLLFIEGHTLPS